MIPRIRKRRNEDTWDVHCGATFVGTFCMTRILHQPRYYADTLLAKHVGIALVHGDLREMKRQVKRRIENRRL